MAARVLPIFLLALLASAAPLQTNSSKCKCFPGDSCWPSSEEWSRFNRTVEGRLISTVPLGSPCHEPTFDTAKCKTLTAEWNYPRIHFADPTSVMSPVFQNYTCDPFQPKDTACTLGNLPAYAVNVANVAQVQKAVNFASDRNLRLVIKNTGHDFQGRSSGAGSLSIWTHNMQSVKVVEEYKSDAYTGPAAILSAGVPASVAYTQVSKAGFKMVGGTCPTVGLAGGFTAGGGHGLMTSTQGMGADNVLEWEVVTASGRLVRATPTRNEDLYWAMSGGGAGNLGVVISMTVRIFREQPTTGAVLSWALTEPGKYWNSVEVFVKGAPDLVDAGTVALVSVANSSVYATITAPNENDASLREKLAFVTSHLTSNGMPYNLTVQTDPTYLEHFERYYGPFPYGIYPTAHYIHARVIPRGFFKSQERTDSLTALTKNLTANNEWGVSLSFLNAPAPKSGAPNAVPSAWRNAHMLYTTYVPWDWASKEAMAARGRRLTNAIGPELERLTPGSITYANEADPNQMNWQKEFFGGNFARLQQVKSKWDSRGVFYAQKSAGAERWSTESGRLCMV